MTKKHLSIKSKVKYCIQWALIYIIVIIIGIAITIVATYFNNTYMQDIASYDYEQYIITGTFNPNVEINGAHNIIYNTQYNVLSKFPGTAETDFKYYQLDHIASKINSDGFYYGMQINLLSKHMITVVVAYPLNDNDIFLFYREPPFIIKTIIIICVMMGMVIAMMGIYLYLIMSMAQKNQKMQRDYVDNITHELKSPIASVQALTETMYDGLIQDEERRKRYYKIILNEMKGLENTVSNMLELSKIQNDQIDCSKSKLAAYEVFGDIIEKYAALCDERGMDFSITPEVNMKATVYTNKSLAARIMDILLDNAMKFADRDSGSIQIAFEETSSLLTVTISDNGTGIAPDDQNLIFSRFYKGDKSHNEKGSGLGLAIATEITNSLGEKLWLKYSGTEGTAFAFTVRKN